MALAERTTRVVATDVTREMLEAVRRSTDARKVANVSRALADAHRLPFREGAFDAIASRIAPHHFADLRAFAREACRTLRAGGAFYVFDLTSPEDAVAADVVNRVERLRDPSHAWSHAPSAWRDALDAAGFAVERIETTRSEFDLEPWVTRAEMPAERERELRALLRTHAGALGGYGVTPEGRMRVLRVEILAHKA